MTTKVEAKNISLSYKEFEALSNVDFTLENERIYGLIGRNGAGKTSLLSLLAAYRKSTRLTILVHKLIKETPIKVA